MPTCVRPLLAVLLLLSPLTIQQVPAQGKEHHVVFVVTSPDQADWSTAMTLADHFIAGVKPEATVVEVLAYGPGIESLKNGAPEAAQLSALEKQGVQLSPVRAPCAPSTSGNLTCYPVS